MTTITNNKLTDEKIKIRINEIEDRRSASRDFWDGDYEYPEDIELLALRELQERRKADNQEPAGYHVIKECGKVGCSVATLEEAEKTRDFWNKKWTIRPYFYTAQPVQETGVYKDMLNIIGLLENNEWAEHCTSTVLGSLLESEITRLVGKEQPAPVVPPAIEPDYEVIKSILPTANPDEYACCIAADMWNACRAAMLQGFRDLSQPVDPQVAEYEQIMLQAGWVAVPVEPTDEMIAAAMECDDVVFDSKDPTAFCVQYREIYCAMVDAAPKQEGNNG
ncbi:hypothetical protein KF477_001757 [Salmonella enterica subsp. diarizonae serovar 50:k:z:[z50],[z57],[z68] [z86]]|uniref:DUF551 domain-containing protein n=1 Tax=Salmonella enterica TaxID=28901 RepID=A0A403T5Y0_SALER|nr:hypothetical protein [Salmonella enterica subsp. diarizonae serovar 50:k:z:[z50],[z57],[z68], [z86]]MMS79239.1 hypothetical protein [Salmonella enterica]